MLRPEACRASGLFEIHTRNGDGEHRHDGKKCLIRFWNGDLCVKKKTFRWFCNIKEIGKSNHGLPRKHLLRISIPKHPTEFLLNSDWTNISHSQRGSSRARVTALSSLFLVLRHIYTRITRGAHLEKSCTWNVTCKKTMPLIWVNYNMSLTSCGHLEMISLYCARALSLRGGYAQPRQSKREISACPELHNRIH